MKIKLDPKDMKARHVMEYEIDPEKPVSFNYEIAFKDLFTTQFYKNMARYFWYRLNQ